MIVSTTSKTNSDSSNLHTAWMQLKPFGVSSRKRWGNQGYLSMSITVKGAGVREAVASPPTLSFLQRYFMATYQ